MKRETEQDRDHCRSCRWHYTDGISMMCQYSIFSYHKSRLLLHYERIGRQSLEGMTHGVGCTEYEEGPQEPLEEDEYRGEANRG